MVTEAVSKSVVRPAADHTVGRLLAGLATGCRAIGLAGEGPRRPLLADLGERAASHFEPVEVPSGSLGAAGIAAWVLERVDRIEGPPLPRLLALGRKRAAPGRRPILILLDEADQLDREGVRGLVGLVRDAQGGVRLALAGGDRRAIHALCRKVDARGPVLGLDARELGGPRVPRAAVGVAVALALSLGLLAGGNALLERFLAGTEASRPPVAAAPPYETAGQLEGEPAAGRLVIRADPIAWIIVDGRDIGPTPLPPLSLAPGPHRIVAAFSDGRREERQIDLGDDTLTVEFR